MKLRYRGRVLAHAILYGTLLFAPLAQAAEPGKVYHFTVLHTNDLHGRFWTDPQGALGLAAQKTLIDGIRAEVKARGGEILVLNAGDVNTGVPESDLQDARPMFAGLNRIGYDAMALGNHEFDKPLSVLTRQRSWARFPLLSANIRDLRGRQPFVASKRFDLGGLKIAVLGLTTPDTARMVDPRHVRYLRFTDPQAEAARLVPRLRRQADVVIALTHLGYYPNGRHGVSAAGDVELARAVPGLDLIVGGHSHTVLCMAGPDQLEQDHVPGASCQPDRQNGSWIVQAGEWGKYVGRADFEYRQGRLTLLRYSLIPVNYKRPASVEAASGAVPVIVPDPGLLHELSVYQEHGHQALGQVVGRLQGGLDGDRGRVRQMPTSLGRFTGRVFIERTGADLSLWNSGGIRDSLPDGDVRYRDVLKVFPFGSTLVTLDLSGTDLTRLLAQAFGKTPGSGGYPQLAGVELQGRGGVLESVRIGGKPIDPSRRYRLVSNSFLASGGDGYPRFNTWPGFVDTGLVDAEVVKDYLLLHRPVISSGYAP